MSALDPVDPNQGEEEADVHFEPVIKLTETVQTKTHEEEEDSIFKLRAKLFRFESSSSEWKERGTGDVRLLQHKESKKIRLVMRRDKTLKVCANHLISADMKLQPNIGSDRSWVWKVHADYSELEPTSETLAIRFANAENAEAFKAAFEKAQTSNSTLSVLPDEAPASESAAEPPKAEEKEEEAEGEVKVEAPPEPEPAAEASEEKD